MKTEKTDVRSFFLRITAFLLGLLSMCGGGVCLLSAFTLANQEFLHWYKPSSQRSFGDEIPVSSMMWEFAVEGIVLFPIGVFLTCFAVWTCFAKVGIEAVSTSPTKPREEIDPNPYCEPIEE